MPYETLLAIFQETLFLAWRSGMYAMGCHTGRMHCRSEVIIEGCRLQNSPMHLLYGA